MPETVKNREAMRRAKRHLEYGLNNIKRVQRYVDGAEYIWKDNIDTIIRNGLDIFYKLEYKLAL